MRSTLIVATFLALASTAFADTATVVVYGKAKPHERDLVATTVATTLQKSEWTMLPQPLSQHDQDAVSACSSLDRPWPCVAPTAQEKGFDRVAVVQVDPSKGGKDLVLTGQIIVEGDSVPSTDQQECKPCTGEPALTAAASELAAKMVEHAKARDTKTTVSISTTPPGAVITIDGQMIAGGTNRTIMVSPGQHTILLQRAGYRPATTKVTAIENKVIPVDVQLVPSDKQVPDQIAQPATTPTTTAARRSRALPIALIGIGGAAVVGGAVAFALNESNDTEPPGKIQPQYHYNTTVPAAVAIGGGAAIAIVGVLLFRSYSHDRATVTAAPTAGGAVVGFSSSF